MSALLLSTQPKPNAQARLTLILLFLSSSALNLSPSFSNVSTSSFNLLIYALVWRDCLTRKGTVWQCVQAGRTHGQ